MKAPRRLARRYQGSSEASLTHNALLTLHSESEHKRMPLVSWRHSITDKLREPHHCSEAVTHLSLRVLLADCTGSPRAPDWAFFIGLTLEVDWARSVGRFVVVQARLSPLFRLPGAPVRGSSRLATPTMRLPVFASSPVCAHRSSALDLPMPLLPLRRYSTSTATAYWRSRSPKLPTQIGTLHRRYARLGPKKRI